MKQIKFVKNGRGLDQLSTLPDSFTIRRMKFVCLPIANLMTIYLALGVLLNFRH